MEKKKNTGQLVAVLVLGVLLLLAIVAFLVLNLSLGSEKLSQTQEQAEVSSEESLDSAPQENLQSEPEPIESFTVTGDNGSAKADSQKADDKDKKDDKKDKDKKDDDESDKKDSEKDDEEEEEGEYLCDYSAERLLTEEDVDELNARAYEGLPEGKNICQMVINEMYARHGYQFSNEEIQNYFNQKEWYQDIATRNTDMGSIFQGMSDIEKANVEFLSPYGEEE